MLRDLGLNLDLDVMKRKKPFKVQLALPNQTITQNIKNVKVANISDVKLNSLAHFEFEIPFLVEVKGDGDDVQYIQNPDLLGVKEEKLIKLTWYGGRINWFKINSIEKTDGENETVNVKIVCDGIESELRKTTITLNELTGIDVYEYFNTVLQQSGWKLGFVSDSLKDTFRSFNDDNKVTKYEAVQNGIETYGAIADFDGETRTLNLFNISDLREFKGVILKKENYANSITINSTSEEIVTRLYATGNENLTIEKSNPTGMRYIEDFSYFIYPFERDENKFVLQHSNYMSDELCHALLDLKILEDEYNPKISALQKQLNDAFADLSKKSLEKVELDGQLITIQSLLDTAKATNDEDLIVKRTQELNDKQAEIDAKQEELDNLQASIDLWNKTIADYQEIISINSFDPKTKAELELFVYEKSFNDDRYIDSEELYKATVEEFEKYQKPVESFSLNLKTFINSLEAQKYHGRINIGEEIKIKSTKLNEEYTSIILGYSGDIITGDYELEISDSMDDIDAMDKLASIIYKSESSSTILENNKYKWNNITSVKNEVENWRDKEINTVENRIIAGANESITIDNRGIMVRNPDFPNERIIIQSGVVALSKDGGETWSTSITPNGVIADTLIGKIIAGNNLIITNDSGSFVIDNTGLTIDMDSIRIMSGTSGNPENVIESWNKLLLTYDEIASDSLVNEYEKNQLQKQWDTIVGITSSMISSFDKGWTGKDAEGNPIDKPVEYDEFLTAYEALNKYLNETKQSDGFALLDKTNRKNTTTVDPEVFKQKFFDYDTKRQALESIISLEFTKSQILVLEEGISLQYVKNDEIVTQLNLSEEGVRIDGKLLEINSKTEFNADLTMNAGVIRGKDDGIVIDLNTGEITLNTKVTIGAGSNLVTDEEIEEIKGKVTATLSNDMVTLFADVNGSSILYNNATTEMNVYRDGQLETTGWTFSLVKNDGVVATIKDNKVQVTSVRDDIAVLTIQAVKGKEKITKDFTLKKYKSGNGNVNRWMMISDSAHKSVHNEWVPSQIIALGNEQQGLDGDITPYWGRYKVYESKNGGVDYLLRYTSADDEKILKYTPVDTDVTHIKVGFYLSGSTLNQIDEQVLPVINDKEKEYTHQAYAYSADGTDRFTKVYPNLNLLPNSTWNLGTGTWTINPVGDNNFEILQPEKDKPTSHILHAFPLTANTQQTSNLPHPIPVKKGDDITISFDFKDKGWTKSSNLLVVRVFPEKDTPNSQANSLQNVSVNSNTFGITENTNDFKRFSFTIKVIADGYLDVLPYNSETSGTYESYWRELKVEKGTVATPWTPHSDEAKSADYPSYKGEYVDTFYNGSDEPNKYTWTYFRGGDGEAGENGQTSYVHTAYAYSSDGTDRFTLDYPNLNLLEGTREDKVISGVNSLPSDVHFDALYYFENGQFDKIGVEAGDIITVSYDWGARGDNLSGNFFTRLSQTPWTLLGSDKPIEISPSNSSGHQTNSIVVTQAMIDGKAKGIQFRQNSIPTTVTINIHNFKIEKNKIETPWMPNSSEVNASDYPQYRGEYTDFIIESSKNPEDYTWTMYRGNDGNTTNMYQAYAWSDDGKFGFSKTYPQLNLTEKTDVYPYVANSDYKYSEDKPYSITYNRKAISNAGLYLNDFSKMVKGESYTISFDAMFTTDGVIDFFLHSSQTAGTFINESIEIDGNVISQAPILGSGDNIPFVFEKDVSYHFVIRVTVAKDIAQNTYKGFIFQPAKTTNTLAYTLVLSRYKMEKGLVETAWMPSKKDAKPTDYPTYVGTQLTTERIQSDNPEDYTWALFKGQDSNAFSAWAWTVDGKDGFTTEYPNLNLVDGTKKPISEDGVITIGGTGSATTKIEYVPFVVDDNQAISNGMRITDDGSKTGQTQSGWNSGSKVGYSEVKDKKVTLSAYVRNDSEVPINIGLQIGMSPNPADQADNAKYTSQYTVVQPNSGITKLSATLEIPDGMVRIWYYVYTNRGSGVAPTVEKPYVWSFAGYKAEWGSKATPWMPAESEYATEWSNYYPKYVGYSETQSENPEDYQWVLNPEWVQASSDSGLSSKADNSDLQSVSDIANDALTRAQNSVLVDDYTSWLEHDYQTTIDSMKEVSDQNKADITSIDGRQTIVEGFYDNMKVKWNFIDESFTFGEEGMFISNSQSQMAIQIASDKIVFWDNNVDVAFITGEFLNIKKGVFLESATIGNHLITKFSDGSPVTIIRYIGGDN